METKYKALRMLTWLYRIIGVLVFVGGIALSVLDRVLLPAIGGAVGGLFIYAFGELLHVLVSIEENTRQSARMLGRMNRKEKDY